jgi:hypothetical protein
MKKILTVLLVLAVMTASVFAGTQVGTDNLTLKYLKDTTAQYSVGWYEYYTDGAVSEDKTEGSFNNETGGTVSVKAYLKASSNFSAVGCTLSAVFNKLESADTTDDTTIAYTAVVTNKTAATITSVPASISSGTTAVSIGTMPANVNKTQDAILEFVFSAVPADLTAAVPNMAYAGDVNVTMTAN